MTLLPFVADRQRPVLKLAILTLAIAVITPFALAQNAAPEATASGVKSEPQSEKTFTISFATNSRDLNDLDNALRNMLPPQARVYAVSSKNAIAVHGTAEDLESASRLIAELDRPRKAYRITYTITDMDNGRSVGTRHIAVVVIDGTRTTIKQGNRVPLVTGMQKGGSADENAQVQYIDVGLNIDADIDGGRLRSKIEQTGVSDEKSGFGAQDPVLQQTTLEGVSNLESGKPMVLGSLDVPGSTRRQEISVTAEPLT